ncbi:MAG: GDP-mannose 4,6-dehydratase [Holosporaceae bacterium]|nr:GDP-mannose 4,6-dehydratase [Holosporaceae bacterium]
MKSGFKIFAAVFMLLVQIFGGDGQAVCGTTFSKNKKIALITGITGQDGSYLAEFLLGKGYVVHGLKRFSSVDNTVRIRALSKNPCFRDSLILHDGDLTDSSFVIGLMNQIRPDEVYNLGAQSFVKLSFECPEYTANVNALGALRILEAIRILGLEKKTKFYQASTSELFGKVHETPQRETTYFHPMSPYACAKLYAYWITAIYRDRHGIFAVNGILYNHESPRRGEAFVTRKITRAVARIKFGLQEKLYLGNLSSKRDWGHAKDYVKGIWLIMQQDKPADFVLATGNAVTVRDFCTMAFREVGIELEFTGAGINEKGVDKKTKKVVVEVDSAYFRRTDVDELAGDASLAHEKLNWHPECTLKKLVKEMVDEDIKKVKRELDDVEKNING